ncbi:5-formyltetrahydrofolate cyclo-ligase [Caloranaerobacter azorensis H53214]|uniref:5-formyltetrahydrofolate cyclo-ligase n=1 Tax=Caloranaerobacter azorensis H53214 TaxID=1156417 RepID=A0A096BHK8_9FIRM|nr:5-formyltetrahydrofolate cyclo-ligase [Caloranaerobacter azorensis]KGG80248.1 5-formyltetrahydrofolate cyclo-ligase [Caloranaerobacter azorensis H53214]
MNKNELRKKILNKRKELSNEDVLSLSNKIIDLLINTTFYKNANYIMTYIDFRNEVKTEKLIKKSLEIGKKIIIPISLTKSRKLLLSELKDYDNELTIGTYGILEPKKEFIREVSAEILDLIIVPGVVFDKRGYRIGYGGGYYDRFLLNIDKSVPKVALAFDFQVVEKIDKEKHDIPVDYIITEKGVITVSVASL